MTEMENCLTINAKKTKVMRVKRNSDKNLPPLKVSMGDVELKEVFEYKVNYTPTSKYPL